MTIGQYMHNMCIFCFLAFYIGQYGAGQDSYLLQCFQAVVHIQSISQCSGSKSSNSIQSKTVEGGTPELVQVVKINYRTVKITDIDLIMSSLGVGVSIHGSKNLPTTANGTYCSILFV